MNREDHYIRVLKDFRLLVILERIKAMFITRRRKRRAYKEVYRIINTCRTTDPNLNPYIKGWLDCPRQGGLMVSPVFFLRRVIKNHTLLPD
jgi:hypothetical protein